MEKRGQAAMEFLMTYGWAILAAVIAIGVLAYFGVFSPGKYMPDICTINAPLGCEEHAITESGVRVIMRNGAGEAITIRNITVQGCASDVTGYPVADGATQNVLLSCTPTKGSKFRGDITIVYAKSGAALNQTTTGSVSGKVA